MGYSVLAWTASHASLATVYVDRVSSVARKAGVDIRPLFARAIAHEIGHLLLNTDRHSDTGMTRARWSHAELRRECTRLAFIDEEGTRMRALLAPHP